MNEKDRKTMQEINASLSKLFFGSPQIRRSNGHHHCFEIFVSENPGTMTYQCKCGRKIIRSKNIQIKKALAGNADKGSRE